MKNIGLCGQDEHDQGNAAQTKYLARDMTVRKLAESKTKLSTDLSTRILTLKTHDGFTVSFAVSDDQFRELARFGAQSAEIRNRLAN